MMNIESENSLPARRPSGRLSKPSMDLLVDNQRILSQYAEPKKKRKVEIKKFVEDVGSQSNYSERSSLSSVEKYKPKRKKLVAITDENDHNKMKIKKLTEGKSENKSDVTNGDKHANNRTQNEISLLNQTPYVSIELNEMINIAVRSPEKSGLLADVNHDKSSKSPDKSVKTPDKRLSNVSVDVHDKTDDDLPLSKIYPDFKPRMHESVEKRDASTLPPKKKIKFINISELNGGSSDRQNQSSLPAKLPKLKLVFSPTKSPSVIMAMPKIPKKSAQQQNGSSDSENNQPSPVKSENAAAAISETHTSPTPPPVAVLHQTHVDTTKRCIRPSCTNIAIDDFRWDKEFCSADCAIVYSKFLFSEWLNQRRDVAVSQ